MSDADTTPDVDERGEGREPRGHAGSRLAMAGRWRECNKSVTAENTRTVGTLSTRYGQGGTRGLYTVPTYRYTYLAGRERDPGKERAMEALMSRAKEAKEALRDDGLTLLHGGQQDDPHWFTDTEHHARSLTHAFGGEVAEYRVSTRYGVAIMDRDECDRRLPDGWAAEDALREIMEDEHLGAIILPGWEWDDEITVLVGRLARAIRLEGE